MKPVHFQCLTFVFLIIPICSPVAQIVKVTENNFAAHGWEEDQTNKYLTGTVTSPSSDYVGIRCEPSPIPAYKRGSAQLMLPVAIDNTLRRVRLRCNGHSGTPLSRLSKDTYPLATLSYSTYIVNNTNNSAPSLAIQIDNDQDGKPDFNLFFDPALQADQNSATDNVPDAPVVTRDTWQVWNASVGWWGIFMLASSPDPPAELNGRLFTLSEYLTFFPDARLINTTEGPNAGGAIRFTVGGDSTDYHNFSGFIDIFSISRPTGHKKVVYDFQSREECTR